MIAGKPVRVKDVDEETHFDDTPILLEHKVRSGITTPIYRQGHIYGVLGAHAVQPRTFSDDEANFLVDVAEILGAAMERGLSEEDIRIKSIERAEQAKAAERRFRFLADASAVLSTSLNYIGALYCTAQLAVPSLADWCFVDVLGGEGKDETYIHRLVVAHAKANEATEGLAKGLQYYYPLDPAALHSTPRVLRSGRPELVTEVTDEILEAIAQNAEHLAVLQNLKPRSYMCVPLRVRRRLIGSIGLVATESEHRYREEELSMAEGLACCAALTIDHMLHTISETNTVQELIQALKEDQAVIVDAARQDVPGLTSRQLEVLELISCGRSAKEIKTELGVSEATVRGHIRLVLQSLGAHSQLEAVSRARGLGLLSA